MITEKELQGIKDRREIYLKTIVKIKNFSREQIDQHINALIHLVYKYQEEENISVSHAEFLATKNFYEYYNIYGKSKVKQIHNSHIIPKMKTIEEYLADYKIFIVGDDKDYGSWTNMQVVDNLEDANIVMFTGGEDVNPKYYGEKQGTYTYINDERDREEIEVFTKAIEQNKKIIGICRGAQLSCVMAGGKLIQDCLGHNNNKHDVSCTWAKNSNYTLSIPGDHHQMMYPFNLDTEEYRIVGYNKTPYSLEYLNGEDEFIKVPKYFREPEIVVFPKINALAIQGHPEWDKYNSYSNDKLRELLLTFMRITKFKTNKEINETVA